MSEYLDDSTEPNRSLRSGKASSLQVKQLDAALGKASLPEPIIAYRGIEGVANLENLKPGDSFVDNGFTSVSLDAGIAKSFAQSEVAILMEIQVPKGVKAAYLAASHPDSTAKYDKELLIARGGTYRVKDVRVENGKKIVSVEVSHRKAA